jgi:hypothetical protein
MARVLLLLVIADRESQPQPPSVRLSVIAVFPRLCQAIAIFPRLKDGDRLQKSLSVGDSDQNS